MLYTVLLFIRAPFYILLVFVGMCSVFTLFWLSRHYLPSDWLERLLWGREGIIPIKPRPKSVWLSWFIVFFLCLIAWYFLYWPSALHDILLTSMARYSLFVLKVPLNTKQASKQANKHPDPRTFPSPLINGAHV